MYLNAPLSEYTFNAFDIETTGLLASDTITTLTIQYDGVYHIWLNTDTETDISTEEIENTTNQSVTLHVCESAPALLTSVEQFCGTNVSETNILTAYNGETWNGGFDLSFLRTLCQKHNHSWIFTNYLYTDLYPLFGKKNRFNTMTPSPKPLDKDELQSLTEYCDSLQLPDDTAKESLLHNLLKHGLQFETIVSWANTQETEVPTHTHSDLGGVYYALTEQTHNYDPWINSKNAITAYENQNFEPLIYHNLADVVKTDFLAELATEQLPQSYFSFKRL